MTYHPTQPSPFPPPVPPSRKRRRVWPWVFGGLAVLGAILVVGSLVILDTRSPGGVLGGRRAVTLMPGDDVVHADEISTIARPTVPPFVDHLPRQPQRRQPFFTGRDTRFFDADSSLVIGFEKSLLADDGMLVGYDVATRRERFRTPLPKKSARVDCALADGRIGCAAGDESAAGYADSLYIYDATTGRQVAHRPNVGEITDIVGAGDRFVLTTQSIGGSNESLSSGMESFGPDGTPGWQDDGLLLKSVGVLVIKNDDQTVEFRRVSDHELIVKTVPNAPATVYATGIAVGNDQAGSTDFYGFDGAKTATLRGWQPVIDYEQAGDAVPALPLVGRRESRGIRDTHIIGAANPATGHLLWRKIGSQFSASDRSAARQVGGYLVIPAGTPGQDVSKGSVSARRNDRWQVLDPYTGEVRSAPISAEISEHDTGLVVSDGTNLILAQEDELVAYRLTTGAQAWRSPTKGASIRQVGARLLDTDGGAAVLQ